MKKYIFVMLNTLIFSLFPFQAFSEYAVYPYVEPEVNVIGPGIGLGEEETEEFFEEEVNEEEAEENDLLSLYERASEKSDSSSITVEEMVRSILLNEKSADVIDIATYLCLVLTGETGPEYFSDSQLYLGEYSRTALLEAEWELLGEHEYYIMHASNEGDDYYDVTISDCTPETAVQARRNKDKLRYLYDTVWEVKENTEGMADLNKLKYICEYINKSVTLSTGSKKKGIADVLYEGTGNASAYTGLIYILAESSGLESQIVNGAYEGSTLRWVKCLVEDEWMNVDISHLNIGFYDDDYIALGYSINN